MKHKLLFLLYGILSLCSCSEPIVETFGNISGIIRDSRTNEPLEGVTVSITPTGASQVTDKNGHFLFDNLDIQEYTVTFTLAGYETNSQKISVKPGLSTSVQIVMTKTQTLLSITPEILDFGKTLSSIRMMLEVVSGQGTVSWTASVSNNWISLSRESGAVTGTDYITVSVNRSGLSAGSYEGTVAFTVNGSKTIIPVNMVIGVNEKPVVTIDSYSDLTYQSVSVNGMLVSPGSSEVSSYGFCWNETGQPTLDDKCTNLGDASEPKAFESIIVNLESSTRYYFRAYATNSVGTSYSDTQLEITTKGLPEKPSVITGEVSEISYSSASVSGSLISTGNTSVTAYGHVWGTSSNPTTDIDEFSDLGQKDEVGEFVSQLQGLTANTTYYVRAYATNERGTVYGSTKTFKTPKDERLNPVSGLYAYYTFENNSSNTVDGAPNASLSGSKTYTSGIAGTKALKLTSTSSLTIAEPMIDQREFTVSFWVKGLGDGNIFHLTSAGKYYMSHILAMRGGALTFIPDGYDLWYRYYETGYGVTPSFAHSQLYSSDWHMITVTSSYYNGLSQYTVKLYIDGEYSDSQIFSNCFNSYNYGIKFVFGGSLSHSGYSLNLNGIGMTIDNLRVYNSRQLSANEVMNLYNYEK